MSVDTFWASDEPRKNKDCVVMSNMRWYSTECTDKHDAVCVTKIGKLLFVVKVVRPFVRVTCLTFLP